MNSIRSRIAPTPSGFLHCGNALNFLLTERLTKDAGGTLRLRIDDLDTPRIRNGYVEDVFETLDWLGIEYSEGPKSCAEQELLYSQHLRRSRYSELLEGLVDTGLVFACTCSRKELSNYKTCRCRSKKLPLDMEQVAWRIYTPEDIVISFEDGLLGDENVLLADYQKDFIIRRRDGLPAYQVASLADDIDFGINLIVRGEDLLTSTAAQMYLADLLGQHSFIDAQFYHHRLVKDENGSKLSKSAGSASLKWIRSQFVSVEEIREQLLSNLFIG